MNLKGLAKGAIWGALQWPLFRGLQPRMLHTNSFLLEGKTKNSLSLSLLVFSNYENIVHYISKLAFSEEPKIELLKRVSYHNMLSVESRVKPDLIFGEFPGTICSFLSQSFLVLPRVNFSLDISRPIEQILGNMMQLRRRSFRKIEVNSYVYESTKDPADFKQFYQNIYLPFTSKSKRDSFSRLIPFGVMEKWFLSGELLLVKLNGARLAGLLNHPESSGTVHCRVIAYSEGLAAQAALYHLIKEAKKDGYKTINYGASSPFMSDGLFFYKKSLGMETEFRDFGSVFGLKICNFEKPARDFIVSNHFLFTNFESMIGLATLVKPGEVVNLSSIRHDHYVRGLDRLLVIYPRAGKIQNEGFSSNLSFQTTLGGIDLFIKLVRSANYEIGFLDFEVTSHNLNSDRKMHQGSVSDFQN